MGHLLHVVVAPVALCVALLNATALGQDTADSNKEMQVLAKLQGTWGIKYTSAPSRSTSEIKYEQILNGRYIQRTGATTPTGANLKILQLMTYDPGEKCYRMWTHSSDPNLPAIEHRGKWDEVAQTMIWEGRDSNAETTTTAIKFESESVMQWTIAYRDAHGKAIDERTLHLVATRRKQQN